MANRNIDPVSGEVFVQPGYDANGFAIPDPTPVAIPVEYQQKLTLRDQVQALLFQEMTKQKLAEEGFETYEEADDFSDDQSDVPYTQYELQDLNGFPSVAPVPQQDPQPGVKPSVDPENTPSGE